MLKQRLLTVAVVLPLFLLMLFAAPLPAWGVFVALVALVGAAEWARLSALGTLGRAAFPALVALAIGATWWAEATLPQGLYASAQGKIALGVVALFWFAWAPLWLNRHWRVLNRWALMLAGLIALVPLWHVLYVLHAEPWTLIGLMSVVWVADTAAYAFGRLFGRNKLAPRISPGKTWEGVAGAALMVFIYVFGLATLFPASLPGRAPALAIGVMMLLLSIEGDLLESWLKRVAGVKDSGRLLPGHGGVLDRIDALTSALPLGAFALWWCRQPG